MSPRVLTLFDSPFPYQQGGRETGLYHLATLGDELKVGAMDFIVMAPPRGAANRFPDIEKHAKLHRVFSFQNLLHMRGYNKFARMGDRLRFHKRAARTAKNLLPGGGYTHVMAANGGPAGLAAMQLAREFGLKSVINIRSHYSKELELTEPDYRPWLKKFREIEQNVIQNVDLVLANGDDSKKLCLEFFGRKKPLQVVYNGVDTGIFTPAPRPSRNEVVFVSNNPLRDIKGPEDAIRALGMMHAELRQRSKLVLFGKGPTETFQAIANEVGVGDRVQFLGEVSHFDLPKHLQAADVAVHPIKFSVGTTHASLETLAAGLPIVAYDSAGLRAVCNDGANGFLIPAGDIKGFSAGMAKAAASAELRQRMGEESRRMSDYYSWPSYARRFFKALEEAA